MGHVAFQLRPRPASPVGADRWQWPKGKTADCAKSGVAKTRLKSPFPASMLRYVTNEANPRKLSTKPPKLQSACRGWWRKMELLFACTSKSFQP